MIDYISKPFKWFFKLEAASGLVLLFAAIIALIISNSELSDLYFSTLNKYLFLGINEFGIKLSVKPQINEGNSIKLDIEQEVSSLSGPISAGSAEIVTNKRAIETVVMVEDNQTIVLGGLIDDDIQESIRKVPLLGDIPVIGKAFRQEQTTINKKNLVVFLKPTIIRTSQDMQALTNTKYDYLRAQEMLRSKKGKTSPDLDLLEKLIFDAEEENKPKIEEEEV